MGKFYEELGRTIFKVTTKDILVVQGDCNAKVGSDAYQKLIRVSMYIGIGVTND
ncbi:hypothetical protein DPMN_109943 [Dreissena polymorpha]|uniref:Uncharacterized protein n=1 Tax=Dreissena polymorpha TaxID=45954 RepID=A0A9D4KBH5_DREPO|nr:hypothetical protein DPMN_109943 [Dreissena polymorpha]